MSLSNQTYPLADRRAKLAGNLGAWLSTTIARLHHRYTSWTERRARSREVDDLYRFSDRELWDIGLSRSDIVSIERGTYTRE
jgi:uncharacterized protein YjiS (DUF1127 family)